jgi:hypothetical protein
MRGWDGGIRTPECLDQNQVPYHLATSQYQTIVTQVTPVIYEVPPVVRRHVVDKVVVANLGDTDQLELIGTQATTPSDSFFDRSAKQCLTERTVG